MKVGVLLHNCGISHCCASAQGVWRQETLHSRTDKRREPLAAGTLLGGTRAEQKKKKEKKGKQERKCNCRRCEMLCFCWEGAVAHCLGDATLQHHKQQLLHVAGIQLSPNGCKDREQRCSSARLFFVYAYKSELRGLGFLVDFFCYLRSVRTSAPCSTFLLHPVMLTYTRIHLDFRRTSSHGGRAAGYFLRFCRHWWLSFR